MEVKLIDKLLYRPVVNTVYMKPNGRLGRINGSDFSFIKGNITLQISLHSFDDDKRNWLIPYKNKMSIKELGQIRTESNLKTTINLTLVDTSDFDADKLQEWFDKEHFFVKLSPINPNNISEKNNLGNGVVEGINLV